MVQFNRRSWPALLMGPLLLIFALQGAAEPSTLQEGAALVGPVAQLEYLEDRNGRLTLAEARGSGDWRSAAGHALNFGYTRSAIWLRFRLLRSDHADPRLIVFDYPQLDRVDYFRVGPAREVHQETSGDMIALAGRNNNHLEPVFAAGLAPEEVGEYYVRIESQSSLNVNFRVLAQSAYHSRSQRHLFFVGIYYGLSFLIAAVNLILFAYSRSRIYLYYSLYVICFSVGYMFLTGIAFKLFVPQNPEFADWAVHVFLGLSMAVVARFASRFLDLSQRAPLTDRFFRLMILAGLFVALSPLILESSVRSRLSALTAFFLFSTILVVAARMLLAGYKEARFFLLAWMGCIVSIFFLVFSRAGLIQNSVISEYGLYFGTGLEFFLLFLAIGDRFRVITRRYERRQAELLESETKMRRSFERFVPNQFLAFLGKDPTEIELGDAVEREMTVFFSDLRSYTSLSETMSPEENFRFLNAILRRTGPLIREHHGFIDKYIGDAIMALFPGSPEDAIQAAIRIRLQLNEYNARRAEDGRDRIEIGVGINTGNLMLGTIGEAERMEGTVISDTVNLASRVEGLTRQYRATIIFSENTLLGIADPSRYRFRILDRLQVKGKTSYVSIFELLEGDDEERIELKLRTRRDFETGLYAYHAGEQTAAVEAFQRVLDLDPADESARFHLNRCAFLVKRSFARDDQVALAADTSGDLAGV